jgi:hypothetical protein
MRKERWDRLENQLLVAALLVLFVASIVTAILQVDPGWQTPLIFLALFAILRIVIPVDEIHGHVKYLRDVAGLSVQTYPTVSAFYADLRHALDEATSSVDLTHIRQQPAGDFTGSQPSEYFQQVLAWAQAGEGRLVRRVICIPNAKMWAWAEELAEHTRDFPRYEVRVVQWSLDVPAINMAIMDGRALFLAVTGETVERTRGVGIEDAQCAQNFLEYFNTLWRVGVPLERFLTAHAKPEA